MPRILDVSGPRKPDRVPFTMLRFPRCDSSAPLELSRTYRRESKTRILLALKTVTARPGLRQIDIGAMVIN